MTDVEEFYRQRDRRTMEYLGREAFGPAPVHIAIGPSAASTAAGQLTAIALVNLVARVHRDVTIDLPASSAGVKVTTPFAGRSLGQLVERMATAIDPYLHFEFTNRPPEDAVTVGVGADARPGLRCYVGAERAVAMLDDNPVAVSDEPATLRGGALAACLAAAALFRNQLALRTPPRRLSAWNYAEGEAAALGPASLEPIDVGRVLVVGAGAVCSALVFWLRAFGATGSWDVVDRDTVALHNTNRGMTFTAAHAGWGSGAVAEKARLAAGLLPGGRAHVCWYHECEAIRDECFDVFLGLANGHDVRTRLAQRNVGVTMHATTGENWLSQLHRHVLGIDDCIRCRTADVREAALECSTATVTTREGTTLGDAALPFLSAASGLMLATLLQRLHVDAEGLVEVPHNDWSWDFGSEHRMARAGRRRCREDCTTCLPALVRTALNTGSRWAHLDPAEQTAVADRP